MDLTLPPHQTTEDIDQQTDKKIIELRNIFLSNLSFPRLNFSVLNEEDNSGGGGGNNDQQNSSVSALLDELKNKHIGKLKKSCQKANLLSASITCDSPENSNHIPLPNQELDKEDEKKNEDENEDFESETESETSTEIIEGDDDDDDGDDGDDDGDGVKIFQITKKDQDPIDLTNEIKFYDPPVDEDLMVSYDGGFMTTFKWWYCVFMMYLMDFLKDPFVKGGLLGTWMILLLKWLKNF